MHFQGIHRPTGHPATALGARASCFDIQVTLILRILINVITFGCLIVCLDTDATNNAGMWVTNPNTNPNPKS